MEWKKRETDGDPKDDGLYLVAYKHLHWPFNIGVNYYDGVVWKKDTVLPILYWTEIPDGPSGENC